MSDKSKMKVVYHIVERNGRSYWTRIGVAFVNQDGSLNVKLESFPINGEMHIRDYVPRDDSENFTTVARTPKEPSGG